MLAHLRRVRARLRRGRGRYRLQAARDRDGEERRRFGIGELGADGSCLGGSTPEHWSIVHRLGSFAATALHAAPHDHVTSRAAFDSAWRDLQPGDKLLVSGITFTGQIDLGHKRMADWAEVHFADDVRFTGGGTRVLNAVWIQEAAFLRFYGGDVTNPTGHSFRIEDANDVLWWGFRSHDSAGGCGSAFGLSRPAERLDIRGEIWNCGLDLSFDPHSEKGTGLHGFYLAGGNYRTSGTFVFKVHDQPTGAAIQVGP